MSVEVLIEDGRNAWSTLVYGCESGLVKEVHKKQWRGWCGEQPQDIRECNIKQKKKI